MKKCCACGTAVVGVPGKELGTSSHSMVLIRIAVLRVRAVPVLYWSCQDADAGRSTRYTLRILEVDSGTDLLAASAIITYRLAFMNMCIDWFPFSLLSFSNK